MTRLQEFLKHTEDGVFYPGHASALIRLNKQLFLFDPIWGDHKPYGDYWTFYPKQINCDEILEKVTAAFVSHIHEDHICEPILQKLLCPVHIMSGRPPLEKRLSQANIPFKTHKPFEWTEFTYGVEIYCVPHSFNSIDSSFFIRSSSGYCCYVGSDNFLSKELILKVAPDVPRLDVAMVPYAFIHWYPHLLLNLTEEEREWETRRLNNQSLSQASEFITGFRPKTVIPFGSNLFYAEGMDHLLNRSVLRPHQLVHNPNITGDFVLANGHSYVSYSEVEFDHKEFPAMDFHVDVTPDQLQCLRVMVKSAGKTVKNHELRINCLAIDLDSLEVNIDHREPEKPCTQFNLNRLEFDKWLNWDISFEQAIGTRRFQCIRKPNIYNLEVFEWMNTWI